MFWDFMTSRPETTHQLLRIFSDQGTPDGYQHMNGSGVNTFKMVNANGYPVYVKFHYLVSSTTSLFPPFFRLKNIVYICIIAVQFSSVRSMN
jgi:catalase